MSLIDYLRYLFDCRWVEVISLKLESWFTIHVNSFFPLSCTFSNFFFLKTQISKYSKISDLVYIYLLYIVILALIIGTNHILVMNFILWISRGRFLIGWAECSIHDLPSSYLSSWAETRWLWRIVAFGISHEFLSFPKWLDGDSEPSDAAHFWNFLWLAGFMDLLDLDSHFVSHCTLVKPDQGFELLDAPKVPLLGGEPTTQKLIWLPSPTTIAAL